MHGRGLQLTGTFRNIEACKLISATAIAASPSGASTAFFIGCASRSLMAVSRAWPSLQRQFCLICGKCVNQPQAPQNRWEERCAAQRSDSEMQQKVWRGPHPGEVSRELSFSSRSRTSVSVGAAMISVYEAFKMRG